MQNIHSMNLFIKKNENYSFKENIHSSEKWIIAQGYHQYRICENSEASVREVVAVNKEARVIKPL